MYIKTSSRVPRSGREPRSLDSKSGVITTRLTGLGQLEWSIMHPIYLYTLYLASRTTSIVYYCSFNFP